MMKIPQVNEAKIVKLAHYFIQTQPWYKGQAYFIEKWIYEPRPFESILTVHISILGGYGKREQKICKGIFNDQGYLITTLKPENTEKNETNTDSTDNLPND